MKILVACEESQEITKAFRAKGHEAWSNDILECSGGNPEWHIQEDCRKAIITNDWDMIIIHTPCTYTAVCGNRWYAKTLKRIKGISLTKEVYEMAKKVCKKVVLEQPKTIMQKYIGKRSQKIQPWQFGHGETKETWLWINGLPMLESTNEVPGRENKIWKMKPGPEISKLRSKTYSGIAKAMAEQWG